MSLEMKNHINNNPFISDFSESVCKWYKEKYMQKENLEDKLNELKIKEEYLKNQILNVEKVDLDLKLNDRQLNFFKYNAPNILDRANSKKAILRRLKEDYQLDLNINQFEKLVTKYGEKNEKRRNN